MLLSVADTGPGIPADLLPHVFDRFAKAADSRAPALAWPSPASWSRRMEARYVAERPDDGGTRIAFELPLPPR